MWQRPNRDQEKGVVMSPFPTISSNFCQRWAALNGGRHLPSCTVAGHGWVQSWGQRTACPALSDQGSVHIVKGWEAGKGAPMRLFSPTFYKWHFVNGNLGSRCDYFFARRYCPKLKFSHYPKLSPSSPLNPPPLLFGSCFFHPSVHLPSLSRSCL